MIDYINSIVKIICIHILTFWGFIKLTNNRNISFRGKIVIVVTSFVESVVHIILLNNTNILITLFVTYFSYGYVIAKVTKNNYQYVTVITFISLTITYLIYIISVVISGILLKSFYSNIERNNIIILFVAIMIESIILYGFFKIKRFKNGVSFLKDEDKTQNIGVIGFTLVGITLVIYSCLGDVGISNYILNSYLFTGILIEIICLTIWIRRKITKQYRQNLRKNEIQELEAEIKAKDEEISKILKENNAIATINHKYSSRIKALEKISTKILTKPEIIEAMKAEFGEEFGELQEQINKISEEYTNEIEESIKHENNLEKTGIFGIDNILEYMKEEAEKENIKFELKITGSINYMIEKIIKQSRLETLLGDHIKDAIIAIHHSDNTYRKILVLIGIIDECYEIKIYDTGIEFEIETLLKLGTEAITTHKETGGSGIGFMTTFETLNETKASLIIEEKHPMKNNDYTKSIAIRFDGKNEYKIKSYRAENIEKAREDNRIIIEK